MAQTSGHQWGGVPGIGLEGQSSAQGLPGYGGSLKPRGGLGSPWKQPRVRVPRVQIPPALHLRGSLSRTSGLAQVWR